MVMRRVLQNQRHLPYYLLHLSRHDHYRYCSEIDHLNWKEGTQGTIIQFTSVPTLYPCSPFSLFSSPLPLRFRYLGRLCCPRLSIGPLSFFLLCLSLPVPLHIVTISVLEMHFLTQYSPPKPSRPASVTSTNVCA